jgi:hypothetical protein
MEIKSATPVVVVWHGFCKASPCGRKLEEQEDAKRRTNMHRIMFWITLFCLLSVPLASAQSVNPQKPVNHARLTTETSAQGGYATLTLPWAFNFQDTNYTATCTPQASDTQLWFFQIYSVAPESIVVEIATYGVAEQLTIHCVGIHD